MVYTINQEGKHQYLVDLARNVSRGLRTVKRQGKWTGNPPYGYRVDENNRLVPGPAHEVAAVIQMFQLRAAGHGYLAIARQINGQGIKPTRATRWSTQTVRELLCRKSYLGHLVIGEHSRAKYQPLVDSPEIVENAHQSLIDQDLWDHVQAVGRRVRMSHTRGKGEGAPLAGLLRCGRCGAAMYAIRNQRWSYYLCSTRHQQGGCGHCAIGQQEVLDMVTAAIRKHVLGGSMDRLEEAIRRQLERCQSRPVTDIADVRKEFVSIDHQLARAASRLLQVDDSLVPDIEAEMLRLKSRRQSLESQLRPQVKKDVADARAIAKQIWELDRICREASPAAVRMALSGLIDHVVLDFEPDIVNPKKQRFLFAGGEIRLRPKEEVQPRQTFLFWKPSIRLSPRDLIRVAS
jgi:site-specific DNA recombinase